MSLTEKTEFPFFDFPIFRYSPWGALAHSGGVRQMIVLSLRFGTTSYPIPFWCLCWVQRSVFGGGEGSNLKSDMFHTSDDSCPVSFSGIMSFVSFAFCHFVSLSAVLNRNKTVVLANLLFWDSAFYLQQITLVMLVLRMSRQFSPVFCCVEKKAVCCQIWTFLWMFVRRFLTKSDVVKIWLSHFSRLWKRPGFLGRRGSDDDDVIDDVTCLERASRLVSRSLDLMTGSIRAS